MKSVKLGRSTSEVEVTNVSTHGFWLLIHDEELFLSFQDFPWFKDVPIGQLLNVELPHPTHLYWPELDVDISVESIRNPHEFPLVSKFRLTNHSKR